MRNTRLIAVLVGLAAIAMVTAGANAVYHPGVGRFLQRDPDPGAGSPARVGTAGPAIGGGFIQRDPTGGKQYADGMNLYQYVQSNPIRRVDPMGLWGKDIHQDKTSEWARSQDHGMVRWAADMVGEACNKVDPPTWLWPFHTTSANLSWHFDIPHDQNLVWGPSDSRYVHAEENLQKAIRICANKNASDEEVHAALRRVGRALHPTQDWVAHGTWDPTWKSWFNWRAHPDGSDDFTKDFAHSADGILRDFERDGQNKGNNPQFVPGSKRADLTKQRTLAALNRFKDSLDKAGRCYCKIYVWK